MLILFLFFLWNTQKSIHEPINGTLSEVVGIDSATIFKNTVKERRIVTPIGKNVYFMSLILMFMLFFDVYAESFVICVFLNLNFIN